MGKQKGKDRGGMKSRLKDHAQRGKVLTPPFGGLGRPIQLVSWRDDRLPEILWAALLTRSLSRDAYLDLFRAVAIAARDANLADLQGFEHSVLSKLDQPTFDTLLAPVLGSEAALKALRPLLIYSSLPDRAHWERHLQVGGNKEGAAAVAEVVVTCFDHQSEPSTDCRWLRTLTYILLGRIHFPEGMEDKVQQIVEFPNLGDMRSVRPMIRSMELALNMGKEDEVSVWARQFWEENWRSTECAVPKRVSGPGPDAESLARQVSGIYTAAVQRFNEVRENTNLDARCDTVFGLTLYSLYFGLALTSRGADSRVEGRLCVRTLTECLITLAYLLRRDDEKLWNSYRNYGSGQAKLAFLKLYELDDENLPSHVTKEELENLANEDVWQEFTSINIGSWSGSDLRKMSEEAGLKEVYDKYYGWPSGYVHGQWSAVRDTVFDLCVNPLHRFHRVPAAPRLDMGSVGEDVVRLLNLTLEQFASAYPPFKPRVKLVKS